MKDNIIYLDSFTNNLNEKVEKFLIKYSSKITKGKYIETLSHCDYKIVALDKNKNIIGIICAIRNSNNGAYIPIFDIIKSSTFFKDT